MSGLAANSGTLGRRSAPDHPRPSSLSLFAAAAVLPSLPSLAALALSAVVCAVLLPGQAQACPRSDNPIVEENCKAGNPPGEWDIEGDGDGTIQGFATDISVNRGSRVRFKIKTDARAYRIDIYRLGYYAGKGARKIATVLPTAVLPQAQPACLTDAQVGLVDCGNWAESASWPVPPAATSGIYIARLVRSDTGGASHVVFVVRDDAGTSDILFQTSDTTWQAYNEYGGNSLYTARALPAGRAYKVSYNRPFMTRSSRSVVPRDGNSFLFHAEYPMLRWLEANGFDVSYSTGMDSDRRGSLIQKNGLFLSVGHDEYWSARQRANVEAARDAGVHLAFFSGNEVFWKTRWEASIDGSGTPYRTLVCYKDTHAGLPIDPVEWTGTWRDGRWPEGALPENALTGQLFTVNNGPNSTAAIQVPFVEGRLRFWRDTRVARLSSGETATLAARTLGYEWDEDVDNGFRPPGLVRLSKTTVNDIPKLLDYGSRYGTGTATHRMTFYKHPGGALVFGAGTIQWSWGLDGVHDGGHTTPDRSMQQATVNLFADMGVQPRTLQPNLVAATPSTDFTPPTSRLTSPAAGATVTSGMAVKITGSASDTGGRVAGVEVSTDGGATWGPARGRSSWTFNWTPIALGPATLLSRAVDDSGNLQTPRTGVAVTVGAPTGTVSLWPGSAVPAIVAAEDAQAVELGITFRSSISGFITGVRFYKGATNSGPHVASLWSGEGALLARQAFTGGTASGWQTARFSTPVAIRADTAYVASYHTSGRYSVDPNYFTSAGHARAPLYAFRDGERLGGAAISNGVYAYSAIPTFPGESWQGSNYWVDVLFRQ